MMNKYIFFGLALFLTTVSGFSQVISAGTTSADLSVSLSGGATYNIPITTPPGIKDINPGISLAYNSQSANGIAGWGWNISGLSNINRVSSTIHHDGQINGVKFDSDDRFSLDGERLILKSGTYGAPNSTYQTENFSNITVKAFGTSSYGASYGPSYFIVYYPDGTKVWYGINSNTRGRIEWALYQKEDPQRNFFQYVYSNDNGLKTIDRILFGTRVGNAAPIEIKFIYKNRNRPELAYVSGKTFKRTKILSEIQVKGNSQLYRKYKLTHDETALGYERLISLQESNYNNEALPSIVFDYEESSGNGNDIGESYLSTLSSGYGYQSDVAVQGEFNGDGRLDFFFYNKYSRNKIRLYDNNFGVYQGGVQNAKIYNVPTFKDVIAGSLLDQNNKLRNTQALTFIREDNTNLNISFDSNFIDYTSGGLENVQTKVWNAPTYSTNINSDCESGSTVQKVVPRTYVEGDFNGDGITDILAVGSYYTATSCYPGWTGNCQCNTSAINNNSVYFINLDRNVTSNFATYSGSLVPYTSNQDAQGARRLVGDFNGNGKSDLFVFEYGIVRIYELDENNQLGLIHEEFDNKIDLEKPILIGDYNGDGKSDFFVPTANQSFSWKFFASQGDSYDKYTKTLPFKYIENYESYHTDGEIYLNLYKYIPYDYNGDGKTDMVTNYIRSPLSKGANNPAEIFYANPNIFNENDSKPTFGSYSGSMASYTDVGSPESISLFLDTNIANGNLEFATITGSKVKSFAFEPEHRKDITLKEINNNGIVHEIYYKPLDDSEFYDPDQIYNGTTEQVYPYVNVNIARSLNLVREVKEIGAGLTRTQQFMYRSAVSHAQGLGFLGFKQFKKSNWDGDGVTKIWSISDHDPQKRGAMTRQWLSLSSSDALGSYINKTDYTYSTQLTSEKVFINKQTQIVHTDALTSAVKTDAFTYDSYNNPLTITSSYLGGSQTTTFQYSDNINTLNSTYHSGRVTHKTTVNNIGTNSFSKYEEYNYTNNLVNHMRKKGNGTSWVNEYYLYDVFGNVTQKRLSATGIADRIENFEYDSSGRYMIKATDIQGLETQYIYQTHTGNPLTTTNPYGLTTTYQYDGWQRVTRETDYLGKHAYFIYANDTSNGVGGLLKTTNYNQGKDIKTYYNAFGWVTKEGTLSLNNKWIYKSYNYDVAGRKIKESEPYFSTGSPTQWNQTYFDQYGRPISQQLYTGRVLNTTYNGLTVSVDDGTRVTSKTSDSAGNILSATDPGGTISYTYHGNGSLKTSTYDGHQVTTSIDGWGRKTALSDPSAGNYTYEYNVLGEITKETSPKGQTQYEYDDYGKILFKEIDGDETYLMLDYVYDNNTKLLDRIDGYDSVNNKPYGYDYRYDSYKRLDKIVENRDDAHFEKLMSYDSYGRIANETYVSSSTSTGVSSTIKVKNIYDSAGILKELRDYNSNQLLWKVNTENAKQQALNITLGNGLTKSKQYDAFGFLTNITDADTSPGGVQALKMDYDFNAQRGILNSRKNYAFTNWDETFSHDSLDRLTSISGPNPHTQIYDNRGRITQNSHVGDYNYISNNVYRLDDIDLNNQGDLYYQQHALQEITYNAFKKPVSIYEEARGRVDFEYGPMMNRTHSYYGGLQVEKFQRQYHKKYSSITPVEIIEDNVNNFTKIITYIGGDGYTAPIAYIKKNGSESIDEYHYLHRDYLGSVLAISDSNGDIKEERQFGAWGTEDKFENNSGNTTFNHSSLINRGFTGHEHFFEVSLLHMNGRMYDAKLGRFLSPDNYIQDPYNTQSFNRYGYVWNNPLSFSDPSGEIAWWVAGLIGAAISVTTNGIINTINGQGFFEGAGLAAVTGFIGGAVAFEIGQVANSLTPLMQAGAHGILGAQMAFISGGNPLSGFLAGSFGSVMAGQAGKWLNGAKPFWKGAGMIGAGGLSGGFGSAIAGGNFWDGVRNGLISSTLNHVVHSFVEKIEIEKIIKKYEANETEIINNTIKIDALGNFTKLGQLRKIIEREIVKWGTMGVETDRATDIFTNLEDGLLALGITASSKAPQVRIAAGLLSTGYMAENIRLTAVNSYYRPLIIKYAPSYAINNGIPMTFQQKENYYIQCNCGGSSSGAGASSRFR